MMKSIFNGRVYRKKYWFYDGEIKQTNYNERKDFIKHETIEEADLDVVLREGDRVLLKSINEVAKITSVIFSTGGSVFYFTDYILEKIHDEQSEESLKEAEQDKIKYEQSPKISEPRSEPKKINIWHQLWK